MSGPGSTACEVRVDGAWRTVALAEAHARHGLAEKRCPACHGRVSVAGSYVEPVKLSLMHRKGHDGCPLMPRRYVGVPRPHPQALA